MKLVIVESPAKCAKIQGFLGPGYKVQATMGHIRALKPALASLSIDAGWDPTYEELSTKRDAIAKLRAAAKGAEVILASDDDREGEAIAFHVCALLKLNPATTPRIVFHEITKPAILAAVAAPRRLDLHKVNAQQARAMLDMLVGFTISKVLWNRVAPKLSAGRCQTPALRLVAERDAEVENHRAAAYWRLSGSWPHPAATATTATTQPLSAVASTDLATQPEATAALRAVHATPKTNVLTVKESVSTSQPPKPLITSTLQQEASATHGLGPKVTMQAAQKLYEAGHITYMRTDNPLLSEEAATAIRAWVMTNHGAEYVGTPGQHTIPAAGTVEHVATAVAAPAKKAKKSVKTEDKPEAQAAHEAIRPTHPEIPEPPITDATQLTVYRLIWRRATQSQMSPATTDVRKATLQIDKDTRLWNAEQTKTAFPGWRVLERKNAEQEAADTKAYADWAPILKPGSTIVWNALKADEHFTKPKGRYTEASLIADLEKKGIGRPSTFATLVSTILERDYVEKTNVEGKSQDSVHLQIAPAQWPPKETKETHKVGADKNKLKSTALGRSVSDFLAREYADLFAYDFTAAMERGLDSIASDEKPWKSLLQETWDTYKERYTAQTSGPSTGTGSVRERILADGVKVILSRKGPLFVRDPPAGSPKSVKATFASLPSTTTFETATALEAAAAFSRVAEERAGELLGHLGDDEIRKKKGPYGYYAECKGSRVPLKGEETIEQVQEKLTAKISFATTGEGGGAFNRVVGEFTIKRGPYGLYFYKHGLKKANFVKFPPTGLDAETVKEADLKGLYSAGLASKKRFVKQKAPTVSHE